MTAAQKKEQRQYEVSNALSTLQRAEQIKRDKGLMKEVQKSAADLTRAVGGANRPPAKKKK